MIDETDESASVCVLKTKFRKVQDLMAVISDDLGNECHFDFDRVKN